MLLTTFIFKFRKQFPRDFVTVGSTLTLKLIPILKIKNHKKSSPYFPSLFLSFCPSFPSFPSFPSLLLSVCPSLPSLLCIPIFLILANDWLCLKRDKKINPLLTFFWLRKEFENQIKIYENCLRSN
jgi:hypothetical protein